MLAWRYAQQHEYRLDACQRLGIHAGAVRRVGSPLPAVSTRGRAPGLTINERSAKPEAIRQCILTAFIDQLAAT